MCVGVLVCVSNTLCSCSSQKNRALPEPALSVDPAPLPETFSSQCAPCRPSLCHGLSPHPFIHPSIHLVAVLPCPLPLRVTWLRRLGRPACVCPLPPRWALGSTSRPPVWFSLLFLSGPCPPPPPLGPFSPSLSRCRKETSPAAPTGTTPAAQIPSTEKKPDPPVRPARPPGPFVTQEPHLGQNGMGAPGLPTPTSALPLRPASLWPDRTGALRPLSPGVDRAPLPPRPSHFDGVCDISCCEVKEGPLRPAPFSRSLLVRVSVFPLVRLSSKQVMVEGSYAGQLQTQPSLHPTSAFSPHSWTPSAPGPRSPPSSRGEEAGPGLPPALGCRSGPAALRTDPGLPLCAPLQTKTSAPRITAAANKTASTPSAATSASVAAASSSTTTSTTARKVGEGCVPDACGRLPLPCSRRERAARGGVPAGLRV